MIKNMRVNWNTEEHKFTFETMGCRMASADALNDIIGSLVQLLHKIEEDYSYEGKLPEKFKVIGGSSWTHIEGDKE